MSITVRRAELKDIPRILDLLVQVCGVHADGRPDIFRAGQTKYNEAELRILLQDESRPVFVGVDDRGIVQGYGFCIVTETKGSHILQDMKELYIDDLCVDQNCRGTGCGSVIYEAVKQYAKDIGCYHLTLNVWACNPDAMAFYKAKGMNMLKMGMETIL